MILYFKYEYERKSILKNSRTEVLSTIHKIYIAIWFLLHVLGYIIQLSFHVVDVNINLDLYKCIWINHRNESFPKRIFSHAHVLGFHFQLHVKTAYGGHRIVSIKSSHASVVVSIVKTVSVVLMV